MPEQLPLLTHPFELERDDLLRRYEADGRYRPDANYTSAAFAGLRDCFLPKLTELLSYYASIYPHLLDAFEYELTRTKCISLSGLVSYNFDGLLLVEQLKRRVGRLKLVAPDGLTKLVFAGLREAPPFSPVVQQQRHHYLQALQVVQSLATATTRDLLANTNEVALAMCRLRAFRPTLSNSLPDHIATYQKILAKSQPHHGWKSSEKTAIERWWNNCFGSSIDWPLQQERREALQSHHGNEFRYYSSAYSDKTTFLDADTTDALVKAAKLSVEAPQASVFSVFFYRSFFLNSILPFDCQTSAVKVKLAVAGIYGLTDTQTGKITQQDQSLLRNSMRSLQILVNSSTELFKLYLNELSLWSQIKFISLSFHDQLGKYLFDEDVIGSIRTFYACLQDEDMPDSSYPLPTAEVLASLIRFAPRLEQLIPEATVIIARFLHQPLRSIYETPGFLADLPSLTYLYPLVHSILTEEEQWFIESTLLEQIIKDNSCFDNLFTQKTSLSLYLRKRIIKQMHTTQDPITSNTYIQMRKLLFSTFSTDEKEELSLLFLNRYDIRYLLFHML